MRTRLIAAFAAGALTAGLVVVGGIAVAQPDEVEITACVTNYNGQMRLVDNGDHLRFEPRLPATWTAMSVRLRRHGSELIVRVDPEGATVEALAGNPVPIRLGDDVVHVEPGATLRIPKQE